MCFFALFSLLRFLTPVPTFFTLNLNLLLFNWSFQIRKTQNETPERRLVHLFDCWAPSFKDLRTLVQFCGLPKSPVLKTSLFVLVY